MYNPIRFRKAFNLIQIDEDRIFDIIRERKPRSVALNGPEPLLPKIQKVSEKIENEFNKIGRAHV